MTLTEQWKKGELPNGWYYTQIRGFKPDIDLYDKDNDCWFYDSEHDIHPPLILAPIPSYEEYNRLKNSKF